MDVPGGPPRPGFYWPSLPPPNAAAMAMFAAQLPRVGGWTPAASLLQHGEQAMPAVSEPSGDTGAPRKVRGPATGGPGRGGGASRRCSGRRVRRARRTFPSIV